jgi:hypothetical protein
VTGPLFEQILAERAQMARSSATPRAELAHAIKQLITTVGLVQLSTVLASVSDRLPDALAAVIGRLVHGHLQLLAVHAAEVTARAIGLAVEAADVETAHGNVLLFARRVGPCAQDPRVELTGLLRALQGPEADVFGPCAGIATLAARIGLHGAVGRAIPGPSQVSTDTPRTPTTRPAPPPAGEEDCDAS